MAYMFFSDEKSYITSIDELLEECDIFTLDKVYRILLQHFYPGCV